MPCSIIIKKGCLSICIFLNKDYISIRTRVFFLRAAMEVGPQPHGVIRANVFTAMQEAVHLTLEWVRLFNSGTKEATLPSML